MVVYGKKLKENLNLINTKTMKLKAIRCSDFDEVGDRPYAVVLDVYDTDNNFLENGTEWSYFETEEEAEDYCSKYNSKEL